MAGVGGGARRGQPRQTLEEKFANGGGTPLCTRKVHVHSDDRAGAAAAGRCVGVVNWLGDHGAAERWSPAALVCEAWTRRTLLPSQRKTTAFSNAADLGRNPIAPGVCFGKLLLPVGAPALEACCRRRCGMSHASLMLARTWCVACPRGHSETQSFSRAHRKSSPQQQVLRQPLQHCHWRTCTIGLRPGLHVASCTRAIARECPNRAPLPFLRCAAPRAQHSAKGGTPSPVQTCHKLD